MSFVIQKPEVFWNDLLACVAQASDIVSIRVMEFEAGVKAQRLTELLKLKVKEGVKATLFIDWVHSRYVHGEINLLPILNKQKQSHNTAVRIQTQNLLKYLRDAGVSVSITDVPNRLQALLPISGRNHTKIYRVDDIVWIGGVHPIDSAFNNIDFMVKIDLPKIVTAFKNYAAAKEDKIVLVGNGTKVLFDGGKIGLSNIYQQAISHIKEAKREIIFMSQFFPDGLLFDMLVMKSRQGVPVKIITSPKKSAFDEFPANIFNPLHLRKANREKNMQFIHCDSGVHAKLIIIDREIVLFGSHNFVSTGIRLGTKEVCIISPDNNLVKDCVQYVMESVPAKEQEYFRAPL